MSMDLWNLTVWMAAVLLLPVAVQMYIVRLPVAPACPTCRSTTRPRTERLLLRWLAGLAATTIAECAHCGWKGRMRWRWATRRVHRRDH